MTGLSLFANIGIAEAYLNKLGFDIVVANELDPRRAAIYQSIYPATNMICGDIITGTLRLAEALMVAIAIAVGFGVAILLLPNIANFIVTL